MKFQYGNGESPLDGYVIRRGIGIGGFGEVYFAESDSGKEVALKRIQKNLDVEMRGVRHCLNLRHPNLVAIYDIRYDNDQQGWIVMEFIEGESLRDHLDRSIDTSLHIISFVLSNLCKRTKISSELWVYTKYENAVKT